MGLDHCHLDTVARSFEKLSNAAKVRPNRLPTAEQSGPTRVVPPADEEGSTDD